MSTWITCIEFHSQETNHDASKTLDLLKEIQTEHEREKREGLIK